MRYLEKMEDGLSSEDKSVKKMGATSNNNAARLAVLQDRKKAIEESLAKCNLELRELCIQEAELTGITPPEMPLEPGGTLPQIRRRVGTAYQLNEELVKNSNKDEIIADLELQIQLHANLAEAALGLANEHNMSKTMKRKHRSEYQKHQSQYVALQEKLAQLKERMAAEQQIKQKKKPRTPHTEVPDNISINTNVMESFTKTELRHSLRSYKHNSYMNDGTVDMRYSMQPMQHYRNSDIPYMNSNYLRHEDSLISGVYGLSLNGYSKYLERENINNMHSPGSYSSQSIPYSLSHSSNLQQLNLNAHMQQNSPQMSQRNSHMSQSSLHSPHMSQHSPHTSQHSPHMSQHSPHSQNSPLHQRSTQSIYQYPTHYGQDYNKFVQTRRQSSPPTNKSQYYPSHTIHGDVSYRHNVDSMYRNPHQLQPHQQYENNGMMSGGLGGCWKRSESGDLFWCNSNTIDSNWQRDKRFGSLDRRKNKRVHKRISPVDNKSATIASVSSYPDQLRVTSVKPSQVTNRNSQDHRQLVRTQSLGSVGAQTVDSVCDDDNSSCESDNRSLSEKRGTRKLKEKEWVETSLDGPISPTHSIVSRSRSQSTVSTILAPEEKYVVHSPPPLHLYPPHPPITPKPPLEIPAESNPSPRIPDTNLELFNNNNMPKNCTVVQAGHCKPYHEETKPFEMSDFYKYSTKFKKSPVKQNPNHTENDQANKISHHGNVNCQRSLTENFQENRLSPFQSISPSRPFNPSVAGVMDASGNLNTSLELGQITVSEHFSAEMNAWYKDHEHQIDNNNTRSNSKNMSTATLV